MGIEANYEGKWFPAIYRGNDLKGRPDYVGVTYDDSPKQTLGARLTNVRTCRAWKGKYFVEVKTLVKVKPQNLRVLPREDPKYKPESPMMSQSQRAFEMGMRDFRRLASSNRHDEVRQFKGTPAPTD